MPHFQQARGAIAPHAREYRTDRVAAGEFGDRVEQDIDRWPMTVDRWLVEQPARRRVRVHDGEVAFATGRKIDPADFEPRAVRRFLDLGGAKAVQPLGEA